MIKKNLFIFFIFLTSVSTLFTKETIKTQSNIGILIVNGKEINTVWSYLSPLIEYFLDDNIKAIVILLEVEYGYFGASQAISLAKSIQYLKSIYKKPVIAYGEEWLSSSAYTIAASADYIMSSPLCILGHLSYQQNFPDYSQQNIKNGININPIKAGKYKYIGSSDLEITKYDLNIIEENIKKCWQNIVEELISLRPILGKHKDKWIEGEIFVANQKQNIDNVFVDKIGDKIDLNNFVLKLINPKNQNDNLIKDISIKHAYNDLEKVEINKNKKNKIIVINAANLLTWQNSNHYFDILKSAFNNDTLGIILNINVYGSNSGGLSSNLYTQIKKLKKIYGKPVIAYIDKHAFSGGYWLACSADYIISSPLSDIGSIGYKWGRLDCTDLDAKNNIKYNAISSNKFGNIFNEHTILGKDEENLIQLVINHEHRGFIKQVKEARPKLKNNEKKWKEAQIYTAYTALDLGLIDKVGCPIDAIRYLTKNKDLKDINVIFINLTLEDKL